MIFSIILFEGMRKVIALDFDGVLHPRTPGLSSQMFQGVDLLASAIVGLQDVQIVIDSTWRQYPADLKWALDRFPISVSSLVIGSTPILGGKSLRELEILSWLKTQAVPESRILVIDDEPHLFQTLAANVFAVNGDIGLTDDDAEKIRQLLT
jgi:hypothetical protein